jgi:hypothetical protein
MLLSPGRPGRAITFSCNRWLFLSRRCALCGISGGRRA